MNERLLTLAMLYKLRCTPTSNFQPIKLLDLDSSYKFTYYMCSADLDQLASEQGISRSAGLRLNLLLLVMVFGFV